MLAVVLQQSQMLAESESVTNVVGNSGTGYGGEGNGPARVKENNAWDDEW